LNELVIEIFEEGSDLMPTIAEQWIEQGREQSLEQGYEAARLMLSRFLQHRFGVTPNHFEADLRRLDLVTLTALSDHAFAAESLTEFEAHLTKALLQPEDQDAVDPA
jgi:hypothetical protein